VNLVILVNLVSHVNLVNHAMVTKRIGAVNGTTMTGPTKKLGKTGKMKTKIIGIPRTESVVILIMVRGSRASTTTLRIGKSITPNSTINSVMSGTLGTIRTGTPGKMIKTGRTGMIKSGQLSAVSLTVTT